MERTDISCKIVWKGSEESLRNRMFLFCIEDKCMTGRITGVFKLYQNENFELEVSFIDPKYFEDKKKIGNRITIQEASKILAEGVITKVF